MSVYLNDRRRRSRGAVLPLISGILAILAMPVVAMIALERLPGGNAGMKVAGLDGDRVEYATEGQMVPTESSRANAYSSKSLLGSANDKIRAKKQTGGKTIELGTRSGLTTTKTQPSVFSIFGAPDPQTTVLPSFKTVPGTGTGSAYVSSGGGSYRTLCVRLCDGFYWPVSYGTSRGGLADDEANCQSSCGSPVKLYYSNSGDIEDAIDLRGRAYERLKNAFRYREVYDSQCKCKPDPWEEVSLERHRTYAKLAADGKLAQLDTGTKRKKKKKNNKSYDDGTTSASFVSYDVNSGSVDGGNASTVVGSTKANASKKSKKSATVAAAPSGTSKKKVVSVMKLGGTTSKSNKLATSGKSKRKGAYNKSVYGSARK